MQTQAWLTAALSRSKRLPPLKQLLHPPQTRPLTPMEREVRHAEFEALTARMGGVNDNHAGSRAGTGIRPDPR